MSFHCSFTWITLVHVPLHIVVLFLIVVAFKIKRKENFLIKWAGPVKEKSRQSGETIYKFNKSLLFNFTFLRLWSDLFLWKQCSIHILYAVDIFCMGILFSYIATFFCCFPLVTVTVYKANEHGDDDIVTYTRRKTNC